MKIWHCFERNQRCSSLLTRCWHWCQLCGNFSYLLWLVSSDWLARQSLILILCSWRERLKSLVDFLSLQVSTDCGYYFRQFEMMCHCYQDMCQLITLSWVQLILAQATNCSQLLDISVAVSNLDRFPAFVSSSVSRRNLLRWNWSLHALHLDEQVPHEAL